MQEIQTYEDVQELYCAEGWGCKCCGDLYSSDWWECTGDTYCTKCKQHMETEPYAEPFKDEPRPEFKRYPHREEIGAVRKVERVYDATSQGFEVAAFQRQEHERIYV